jgi:pSer/pThr/pTyr-binding forkhead associated (FHA) protein
MSSTKRPLATPYLVVSLDGNQIVHHPIRGREATVGRDPENDICIPHHLISKFHAKLLISNQSVTVIDLGSANKTRLNGQVVTQATVRYGDELQFARVTCRLVLEEPQGADLAEGLLV